MVGARWNWNGARALLPAGRRRVGGGMTSWGWGAAVAGTLTALGMGCPSDGSDDDSAADDDAVQDDDSAVAEQAPVISDLSIELQGTGGDDDALLFQFHYQDPDADIPGGLVTLYTDGLIAAEANISPSEPFYEEGDIPVSLGLRDNLTYGATFLFGVSLTDAGGHQSNRLELEYTIPDA